MQTIRNLAKKVLSPSAQNLVKKKLHQAGLYTWATKSYEVWLILQNLLYLTRPQALVEFGAGRSTNYLAEYAAKFSATLVSFEQNLPFCRKVNTCLKLSFLPSDAVKYAPIKKDWYDLDVVKKHLSELQDIDFLFLDGPVGFDEENRGSQKFYTEVVPYLKKLKLVVIDDVQYKECDEQANFLVKKFNMKRYDVGYNQTNTIAFLLSDHLSQDIHKLPAHLLALLTPRN